MVKKEVFWKNPGYTGFRQLKNNIECDYLIVGGGVTGVSLAYFLQKRNKKKRIVLIEKNKIANGATGRAAGILTPLSESDIKDLIKVYGKEKGLTYYNAALEAMHQVKHIIKEERIDCDFEERPNLYGSYRYNVFNEVLGEYRVEKDLHMKVKLLVGKELKKEINTKLFKNAIYSHQSISINPLKYTQNLSKKIGKKGVNIYEYTPLVEIKENTAITPHARINFMKVIIATDTDLFSNKIIPIKSTIAISKKLTKKQLRIIGMPHKAMLCDAKKDFNYLRFTKDNRILSGYGGYKISRNGDKTSFYEPHLREIKSFLKRLFPDLSLKIEYAWSGTLGIHINYIPIAKIAFTPMIKFDNNQIKILGAAGQVPAVMAAKYVSGKIFNQKSVLDQFFH